MRHNNKINLVRDKGTAPGPVSSLSDEEQARYADLADVALKEKREPPIAPAGSRAHQEHELLKQELLKTIEQLQGKETRAA